MQYDHHTFHNLMLGKAEQSAAAIKDHVGKDPMRLKFHFMPPAYWMNDPNGLILLSRRISYVLPVSPLFSRVGSDALGRMQKVKIWFIGNIFLLHLRQVKSMILTKKADVFPEAPSMTTGY